MISLLKTSILLILLFRIPLHSQLFLKFVPQLIIELLSEHSPSVVNQKVLAVSW